MNSNIVSLIYQDETGRLYEEPELQAVGLNGIQAEIADDSWVDLPSGGELVALPGRLPTGYDSSSNAIQVVEGSAGKKISAVAAILPVGYTRKLLPGYELDLPLELPLFGYTAAGSAGGRIKVAAIQTDADLKWNPSFYNTPDLPRRIARKREKFPGNRILEQLAQCALEYHCLTAQNIFYERWEAGIPVSPRCNAGCLGCISKQPAECCPAPQSRIQFTPSAQEIVELMIGHLESAADGIISFGQGCEGEPVLESELLANAIRSVRERTARGTININTNAGDSGAIRKVTDAGVDSIRISLFSARPENYGWYHHPNGYGLSDVRDSAQYASDHGVTVAINLLFFPGYTNQREETAALYDFIAATGVKQVQIRNLNLDPEKLAEKIKDEELPGVDEWLTDLKGRFPGLSIGNYTRPKNKDDVAD
jgi:pyruvate-formate lyase-activating enzyme